MKVTTYAPPFRPPFFGSLENLYSFDPYILAKMRKMSYFDPYFSSKLGKMYSFDPPFFFTLVAFRVDGRCWASLSKTWHDCLLNLLFRSRSKKTPKLRVTGLCAGNSPVTGEFPAQRASNAENVSIWWRHHEISLSQREYQSSTSLDFLWWDSPHKGR